MNSEMIWEYGGNEYGTGISTDDVRDALLKAGLSTDDMLKALTDALVDKVESYEPMEEGDCCSGPLAELINGL